LRMKNRRYRIQNRISIIILELAVRFHAKMIISRGLARSAGKVETDQVTTIRHNSLGVLPWSLKNIGGTMNGRVFYSQYLGFFTIGFVSNLIGPMLPTIRAEIPISYLQSGLLLTGMLPGIILSVIVGGYLADRYGTKELLMAGGVALGVGLLGSMIAADYLTLLAWMVLCGLGFGSYEIGINVLCTVLNGSNKVSSWNFLHFFYGLGAICSPIAATICLNFFASWRLIFGLAALLPFMVMMMLKPLKIPKHRADAPTGGRPLIKKQLLWICGVFIFIYVGIEVLIQGWLAVFWNKLPEQDLIPASLVLSFFWASLTLGRLISGNVADRLGAARFLTTVSLWSMGLAIVWVFAHSAWSTFLLMLLLGLLLAGIYPTLLALTTSCYPGMAGMVTAFISLVGSLGALAFPVIFGIIADWIGILHLPLSIMGLAFLMYTFAKYQEKLAKGFTTGNSGMI
jgi:fucose permease